MQYDVTVIGSGPGGYVAAIRAAQLGMKTALIERYPTLGGTCLNVGCIPSKALLDSTEHYHNAQKNFKDHGIIIDNLEVDMDTMIDRKDKVVASNVNGLRFLMKKNEIDVHHGHGSFVDKNTLRIEGEEGDIKEITSDKIVIATGSKPITPEAFNYDKERIITSTEALNITKVPDRMVVIGAGIIGLEMGSVFARLGTEVVVVEYLDHILTGMDRDTAKELQKTLKKLGITFHFNSKVISVDRDGKNVTVEFESRDNSGEKQKLECDYCLIAIGRRPYTDKLGLENVEVTKDDKGRIEVDEYLKTGEDNIYAIGDVIKGAMLAHKAEEEGVFVMELINGQKPHVNYNLIPGVIYTWPELAGVGKTEEELSEEGVPYKVGKFPFKALGRAKASGDTAGLVKIIAHKETDEVLGVHMVGPRIADIIAEVVLAMEFRASAEDIARTCHAHPTFTEAVKEAALDATDNRPIHF